MKTIEINCRREHLKLLQNLNNEVTCKTDTDDFDRSISVVIITLFIFLWLNKQEFWDNIHLRYGWTIPGLPATRACGGKLRDTRHYCSPTQRSLQRW